MLNKSNPSEISSEIRAGKKRALAGFITELEKEKRDEDFIAQVFSDLGSPRPQNSIRLSISGPPGVGKSSSINEISKFLVSKGKKVAVLAVDPSSPVSGGSILADKTRMTEIANLENIYIRPSPNRLQLGGIITSTRESILACEAAGYDWIIIETVGIGQSEYLAANITDYFLVLYQPESGDQLQGLKKGVLELSDMICVNKADGSMLSAAQKSARQLQQVFNIMNKKTSISLTSSYSPETFERVTEDIDLEIQKSKEDGSFQAKRNQQNFSWLKDEVRVRLQQKIQSTLDLDKIIQSKGHIPHVAASIVQKIEVSPL